MIYSAKIMSRIGAAGLLMAAFSTYALRWLLFSIIDSPTWVLILQPLHGIAFAAFLVGGITYINARTPAGLSTTAQAIFTAVTFGIGAITGALLGGYLYDTVGMVNLFRVLTLVAVSGLVIFWLGGRVPSEVTVETTLGES
jgi:PPP family 3-phenylpropionic acid transporter